MKNIKPKNITNTILQEYLSNGMTKMEDIMKSAHSEIDQINEELKTFDKLILRKSNLKAFLRNIGDPTFNGAKAPLQKVDLEFGTESAKSYQKQILEAFAKRFNSGEEAVTNRSIIKDLDGYKVESVIFANLKYLGSKNIIVNNNGELVPGENWEQREEVLE